MCLYHLICFEFYLSFPDEFSYIFPDPGIFQLFVRAQPVGKTTMFCFLFGWKVSEGLNIWAFTRVSYNGLERLLNSKRLATRQPDLLRAAEHAESSSVRQQQFSRIILNPFVRCLEA